MELKISKIQWRKVIAVMLTLCMAIAMVQVPVNAEETGAQQPAVSRHLNVGSLKKYKKTATFFDATANPGVSVTTMQAGTSYTVDPGQGSYDAKWFAFTADTDGMYVFEGKNIEHEGWPYARVSILEKNGEVYKQVNYSKGYPTFNTYIKLKAGTTYYICAGYKNEVSGVSKYQIKVTKPATEVISYAKNTATSKLTEEKVYQFKAKATGYHILKISHDYDNKKIYLEGSIKIKDEFNQNESVKYLETKDADEYDYFYAVQGETYYIYKPEMTMYDDTKGDYVNNVNVTLSIAYYNGKASMSAIKTQTPWIPDDEKTQPSTTPGTQTSVKVSNITITADSNKIAAGKKVQLTATVAPANASNKAVKWTTSNKKVAVVSQNGVVTVDKKAAGKSVIITAIAADGSGARATYKITVMKDAVKNIVVTGAKQTKAGKKIKLKAKVAAGKKANKKLVWSSSNPKFATVNNKGVVTTKKAGKGKSVKITAKSTDGSNKKKVFVIKIK